MVMLWFAKGLVALLQKVWLLLRTRKSQNVAIAERYNCCQERESQCKRALATPETYKT